MNQLSDIPFSEPFIDEREAEAVLRVLRGKWLTTGPEVKAFEAEMKSHLGGVKAAVAVSSGTAAVDVVLATCGIGQGDEVVTSAYSFASPVLSMLHRGITPVFADIDPQTFNLSPDRVEELIEQRYRWQGKRLHNRINGSILKAILIVHYGGQPAEIEAFSLLAKRYHLQVIEDAAHAVGSYHRDIPVGASGHPVCFSFYSNKNLTTGEGGMVVWDRPGVEKVLRSYALHGISKSNLERYQTGLPYYDVVFPGYKANLNDLAAALGRVQLSKLEEITRRREEAALIYNRELADLAWVQVPVIRSYNRPSRHLYPLLLSREIAHRRDDLIRHLRGKGIFPSVHFIPIHHHTFYKKAGLEQPDLPVTEDLFRQEISLPLYPTLSEADVVRVAGALKAFGASK